MRQKDNQQPKQIMVIIKSMTSITCNRKRKTYENKISNHNQILICRNIFGSNIDCINTICDHENTTILHGKLI